MPYKIKKNSSSGPVIYIHWLFSRRATTQRIAFTSTKWIIISRIRFWLKDLLLWVELSRCFSWQLWRTIIIKHFCQKKMSVVSNMKKYAYLDVYSHHKIMFLKTWNCVDQTLVLFTDKNNYRKRGEINCCVVLCTLQLPLGFDVFVIFCYLCITFSKSTLSEASQFMWRLGTNPYGARSFILDCSSIPMNCFHPTEFPVHVQTSPSSGSPMEIIYFCSWWLISAFRFKCIFTA